jgi:hypothetical protein
VSVDEQHVALPKLYGAPAYARPPAAVADAPRPFDPDDMPIEAWQSDEDREFSARLPARAWAPGGAIIDRGAGDRSGGVTTADHRLRGRPLRLRSIAGRLLGGS